MITILSAVQRSYRQCEDAWRYANTCSPVPAHCTQWSGAVRGLRRSRGETRDQSTAVGRELLLSLTYFTDSVAFSNSPLIVSRSHTHTKRTSHPGLFCYTLQKTLISGTIFRCPKIQDPLRFTQNSPNLFRNGGEKTILPSGYVEMFSVLCRNTQLSEFQE